MYRDIKQGHVLEAQAEAKSSMPRSKPDAKEKIVNYTCQLS